MRAVLLHGLRNTYGPLVGGNIRGGEPLYSKMIPRRENHEGPGSTAVGDLGLRIDGSQNRGAEKNQESSTSDTFLRCDSNAIEDDGSSGGSPDVQRADEV